MKRLAAIPIVTFVLLMVGMGVASAQPETHTVVRGDTLWALSQEFHTTVQALASTNGIPNPNLIFVGQVLTMSGGPVAIPAPKVKVGVTRPAAPKVKVGVTRPAAPHKVFAAAPAVAGGGMWACIIRRESGGNPTAVNRSSGASGLFQIMPSTARGIGFPSNMAAQPVSVQWAAALKLYSIAGWAPWGGGCR